jgi:hypothetical protein
MNILIANDVTLALGRVTAFVCALPVAATERWHPAIQALAAEEVERFMALGVLVPAPATTRKAMRL